MQKGNPFLSVFLLLIIEVLLFNYLNYIGLVTNYNDDAILALVFLPIPLFAFVLNFLLQESPYKKSFRIFTFILIPISLLLYGVTFYIFALAKAFQH